jgi:hypothetical protein
MENQDAKTEKESCCSSGKGCGCGKGCCAGKAAFALILLLIGGLIGYFVGHCGMHRGYCPMPMSAPMVPPGK